ncbi:tRNA-dihydrouridine synthase, partial [Agrobacterium sp. S2]|nr:tRNA-dihydrouridine synthase [Agrobacterium sp. S2]
HAAPHREDIPAIAVEHYEMMLEFYGREAGLRHARKHLGWYLDRFAPGIATTEKAKIMTSRETGEVADLLRSALCENASEDAARKAA